MSELREYDIPIPGGGSMKVLLRPVLRRFYRVRRWKEFQGGCIYDTYQGFLVRAESEEEARLLCAQAAVKNAWHESEEREGWLTEATVEEIPVDGASEILLEDYLNG